MNRNFLNKYIKFKKIFILSLIIIAGSILIAGNCTAKNIITGENKMDLENLRKQDKVIDYFIQLAQIPSPSLKEDKVSDKIIEILTKHGITVQKDAYGNVSAYLESNNSNAPAVALSSHMDVVGTDEPVNIRISKDGKYIETDKTRTLGADDKAGGAVILDTLIYFKENPQIPHPKIEAFFTRDEESGMSGIKNLDTTRIASQNVLILDGDKLGECNVAGAGFTNLTISVTDGKSGHSGNDIGDTTRVNANKVLGELIAKIPQGVYKKDETGVVTSINSGAIIGGSTGLYLLSNKNNLKITSPQQIMEEINDKSFRNIIVSNAYVNYSIRSSEPENETQLRNEIETVVKEIRKKYQNNIKITAKFETHVKPFVKDANEEFLNIVLNSAKENNLNSKASSFHAAAETHVLQNSKVNMNGKKFKPLLLGVANILNMHSSDEQLDYQSLIIGRNWVRTIIINIK